jgi:lysophospholipase L1-like esterase
VRRAGIGACVLAAVLTVAGPVAWATGEARPAAAAGSPASTVGPVLSVSPATALSNGQQVEVTGSGFGAGSEIVLGECRQGATAVSDCSTAGAVVVTADAAGSFETTFAVSTPIQVGAAQLDCAEPSSCELAAGVLPNLASFAAVPISFRPATPPSSSPPAASTRYYLALGDSLAAGFGAPAGEGYVDDLVRHYQGAIPGLELVDLGCPGETTVSFIDGGKCPYPQGSQLAAAEAFLGAHPGQVALVTLDIGGDDVTGCASGPAAGVSSACVANAVTQVNTDVATIGAALRSAAGGSVPIAGMTYFDPFVVAWLNGPAGEQEAVASVQALDELNTTLTAAYGRFGAVVADVAGAFSSTDLGDLVSSSYGTVPKAVAVACAWLTVVCRAGGPVTVSVHPNATGYAQIAAAFEVALGPLGEVAPPTTGSVPVSGSPPATSVPPASPTLAFTGFDAQLGAGIGALCLAVGAILRLLGRRRRPGPTGDSEGPGAPASRGGAGERVRTSIPLGGPGPKPGASASSATPAPTARHDRV